MKATHEYYWRVLSSYECDEHQQRRGPKRAICRSCRCVLDDWYPRPLEAALKAVARAVMVDACKHVFHTDVWRQLAPHSPNAVIGPVTMRKGDIDAFTLDWTTILFPPDEMVHVRGSDTARYKTYRICTHCNRQIYGAVGSEHLVQWSIPKGRAVFMDRTAHLIVAEPIAQRVDWSSFADFQFTRLPVLQKPLDGLRLLGDPDWSTIP